MKEIQKCTNENSCDIHPDWSDIISAFNRRVSFTRRDFSSASKIFSSSICFWSRSFSDFISNNSSAFPYKKKVLYKNLTEFKVHFILFKLKQIITFDLIINHCKNAFGVESTLIIRYKVEAFIMSLLCK